MTEKNKLWSRPREILNLFHWLKSVPLVSALLTIVMLSAPILAADDDKPEIPDPENITLETKDGLLLRCTYYAGTKGKKTVPIILLHGWEGRRGDYDSFASMLQKRGHAVIAPDLRGHGDSKTFKNGETVKDIGRLRSADLELMAQYDIESVKKFLMKKNNAGELNIELLCVVASDASCPMAINWIVQDWSWAQLPAIKQGQDVKALVMLSPQRSFKGYSANKAMAHPFFRGQYPIQLSILVAVGSKNSKANSEAKRLHTQMKRFHIDVKGMPRSEAQEKQDLFLVSANSSLQGTKLLDPRHKLAVDTKIAKFIELRLINKGGKYTWRDRTR